MVDSSGNLPLCSWHSDDYHRTQVNLNMLEEECHRRPFKQRIPSLFDVAFNMKVYSVSKPLPYLPNTKISASVHILLHGNVLPLRGRPSPKFCTSVPIRSPKRNVRCLSLSSFSVRLEVMVKLGYLTIARAPAFNSCKFDCRSPTYAGTQGADTQ